MNEPEYLEEVREWQISMDVQLKAEDSWLTLVGLYWLQPGDNLVGSNPNHQVPLPTGTPETVGTLNLSKTGNVLFETSPGIAVRIDGKEISGKTPLEPDTNRNQTIVGLGTVSFYIIVRGDRTGVRIKKTDSPTRVNFKKREWWPIEENYRVTAHIHYYEPQKMVDIPDVLGDVSETAMDAYLEFELDGQTHRLDAMALPSGQFYILIHDLSCGHGSYPAGRFLVSEYPEDEIVLLDFNKAHNPPCAFTSFATCPLPPKQNYLQTAINAGEKYIKHISHA